MTSAKIFGIFDPTLVSTNLRNLPFFLVGFWNTSSTATHCSADVICRRKLCMEL